MTMTLCAQTSSHWDELPHEILLQILCYLEPHQLPKLQLVSRNFRDVVLDDELWKHHCFERSSWYAFLRNRRKVFASLPESSLGNATEAEDEKGSLLDQDDSCRFDKRHYQFLQDMANWDPAFPDEHVSWYNEYIQRQGPPAINWLETPRLKQGTMEHFIEVRGMALFSPNNGDDGIGSLMAVSPLDDGSVCLWDVNGTRGKRGGIIASSKPDILFFDGRGDQNTRRSKKIDTGVTECVSVNNSNNRAVFAVQSHLIEVDLSRLQVDGIPMTVGTSLGIHLQDFRAPSQFHGDVVERLDILGQEDNPFKGIFDPNPLPPYASLSQPTPTSILHLPRPAGDSAVSDDIYVAGRFSNILHYDRRHFPKIVGSIYSGSRLSSLAALPYPFSTLDHEVRRRGELTAERVHECKTASSGRTLIAGGEYKTKGSLEVYGLDAVDLSSDGPMQQNSTMKNRYTAASSIILSVINHGTKVAFSDGAGQIKWFERDGYTECRRIKVGHSDVPTQASLFASMPGSDDLARKILSTKTRQDRDRPNEDNVIFWTGDKLGMVSFTGDALFTPDDFQDKNKEVAADERQRQQYSQRMREALEKQADDAREAFGDIAKYGEDLSSYEFRMKRRP
ncbi:hypothetical protein FCIRC_11603 [Fusarium circinatum]|uniref:F-box domain-containing protein n=1 Tax=Fusarium circinatum TaxID=48490 RepID=A0A8H5T3T8_FUSCI|nr:hypothetical protein FCIRC_11603 [Fusarium circinatum]